MLQCRNMHEPLKQITKKLLIFLTSNAPSEHVFYNAKHHQPPPPIHISQVYTLPVTSSHALPGNIHTCTWVASATSLPPPRVHLSGAVELSVHHIALIGRNHECKLFSQSFFSWLCLSLGANWYLSYQINHVIVVFFSMRVWFINPINLTITTMIVSRLEMTGTERAKVVFVYLDRVCVQ